MHSKTEVKHSRSRFAWYGPELPRDAETSSGAGDPLVSDGVPWVDIAERECSIVIIANSCSRSNEDSLRTPACLERQRTRRNIHSRDQSDSDALLRVGARSDRKHEDRKRDQTQDRSHHEPPRRALCTAILEIASGQCRVRDAVLFSRNATLRSSMR